jgi:PQQ-like domain
MPAGFQLRYLAFVVGCLACAQERRADEPQADAAVAMTPRDAGAAPQAGGASVAARYMPPSDAPLPAPSCGGPLPPGETRASVKGVIGRVAVDEHGNVYAPSATAARELALTALDACGKQLWQRVVAPKVPESLLAARLPGRDEVVLDSLGGSGATQGLWRFDRKGEALESWSMQGTPHEWVASTDAGLLLRTYDQHGFLTLLGADGMERRWQQETVARQQTIPTGEEECAAFGTRLACQSVAFDSATLRSLWATDALELIDGTTRHSVNPASDGERLYSLVYGVSTYFIRATRVDTGEQVWARDLGPSPSGQFGLATGGPIIGEDGAIYVYIAYSKQPVTRPVGHVDEVVEPGEDLGWLIAFEATGEERFRDAAPHGGFADYDEHATHLAGDDGAIYFATAKGVFAVDARDGSARWQRMDLGRIDNPRLTLSPDGDLLVQTASDELIYLATDAHGAADSPWPLPGGDRRNLNAR